MERERFDIPAIVDEENDLVTTTFSNVPPFVTVKDTYLSIQPDLGHAGTYFIAIILKDNNADPRSNGYVLIIEVLEAQDPIDPDPKNNQTNGTGNEVVVQPNILTNTTNWIIKEDEPDLKVKIKKVTDRGQVFLEFTDELYTFRQHGEII